ncbi:hypothetical protein P0R31_36350 [Bradyrhizobium yuanmingense]|uniref:hypothetical protein n=1 Tax=Bradyrhizobium yuanmingense TaxID=108015 RepID=UPI0023B961B3|nr:hypothetical protein [Bradyrhizobium yuanmingense]MDF0522712.1 hypothetical protein [Bradyrhizobium yuanmingense]
MDIHPQVGVSFFRIDLGVVHPDFPGRYLAGVECDGAAYHRSATARDRDRLREMVLTDLGWRIRRIWSTEWWMDAATATDKLHTRLVSDLDADRASRPTGQDAPPSVDGTLRSDQLDRSADITSEAAEAQAEREQTEPAPEPANDDGETIQEAKVYARGPTTETPEVESAPATTYMKADPASVAQPDRERFYDVGYRGNLRSMVGSCRRE